MTPPDTSPGLPRRVLGVAALAAAGFVGVQAWHSDAGATLNLGLGANETTEQAQAGREAEAAIADLQRGRVAPAAAPEAPTTPASPAEAVAARCDGRTFCSQMNSCAEARWFLQNCPGTEMDGDHDGIPCEQQWCSAN